MTDFFTGGLTNLPLLSNAKSRSVSAENFTGEKGKGGMAETGPAPQCYSHLGQGWKVSPKVCIEPGETFVLTNIDGPGVIQSMWFGGQMGSDYILRIFWDEQEFPSVESCLPNFFGYGWVRIDDKVHDGPFFHLNSQPVAVNPNRGMNCFWPMPFKKKCKITIENRSDKVYTCFYQINYVLSEVSENAAYFHAQIRRTNPVPYKSVHTIIDGISGKGHYVGTTLFIGLNGSGNWWGEGEVKFYLDGDTDFPTICGTGTEDYVGGSYNWEVSGAYVPYSTPYMGMHQILQPDNLYKHQRRFSMYRWHIMDAIHFNNDIRVTIQDLGWDNNGRYLPRQDDITSVAYWYQTLPTKPFPKLPSREYLEII